MDDVYRDRIGRMARILYRGGAVGDDGELDESLIDDHSTGEPLAVRLGTSAIPKGIEQVVMEMEPGEEREVTVPSELAYGVYNPKEVQWYTRVMIPHGNELHVGSVLVYTRPADGTRLPARVIDETDDGLKIDLNHPFAGKDLKYWIKLVDLG